MGVSSIVLEVATGLVLGPTVLSLIPAELTECFDFRTINCDERKWQERIADKGYKFCDLQAYLDANLYAPGQNLSSGFWGDRKHITLDGHEYSLDGSGHHHRRLAGGKKGKTDFDSYGECLIESCNLDLALRCATTPDIFTLIGHTGVAMMIFESGMHFDFEQAKTVGPWACAVAILGTFLPIIFGAGLAVLLGFDLLPHGLSAGVSLAPTSVGIALKLLHEAKALQTYFGQAVMTAAFVDDVLSLVLFSILFSLGDDMTFMTFLPLILGIVFMCVAIVACVTFWPKFISCIFSWVKETKPDAKVTRHDEVMWFLMFATLCVYALVTHLCGTHLWGCFIAGMSFATHHHAHHVWVKQVKRITCWFIRIFFACTLAWSIPVTELFSLPAFWKGTIMGIVPCILTKVCCAPFMGKSRWVIGWAMVGRAEFAYFIAIMANSMKMMEDALFAILVWALLYATIFAPLIFRKVLHNYMVGQGLKDESVEGPSAANSVSGHLPDVEQEQIEEQEHKFHDEFERLQKLNDEKDEEIKRLREYKPNSDTAKELPNSDNAESAESLKAMVAKMDGEISDLKAKLEAT